VLLAQPMSSTLSIVWQSGPRCRGRGAGASAGFFNMPGNGDMRIVLGHNSCLTCSVPGISFEVKGHRG
jgi:hypothetical protein